MPQVLWFSTSFAEEDEDSPDWYGNVQFAVDAQILLEQWKYSFLVEMMTTPTHTTSRILMTNTDYSAVLQEYDRNRCGGPWQVTAQGQWALSKCSRFRFRGTNHHEHILEFMLDASPQDEQEILRRCHISFRNHEEAQNMKVRHVCNRYQRVGTACPTPYTREVTALFFFSRLQNIVIWEAGTPRLSECAQEFYKSFLEQTNLLPSLQTLTVGN